MLIPFQNWQSCISQPATFTEVGRVLQSSFFNALCKSCGEITQAQSPAFVRDGKPFQRDYDALDLLSFSFLLKPRYQLSVRQAQVWLDSLPHPQPPAPSPSRVWMKFPAMTSLLVLFTAGRQQDNMEWLLKCTFLVACWTLLPLPSWP